MGQFFYSSLGFFRSLRLWNRPVALLHSPAVTGQNAGEAHGLLDDEQGADEHFVSSYEKEHPLEIPKALLEQHQWALLKAIGVIEDDKGGKKRGKAFKDGMSGTDGFGGDSVVDPPGTLGSKLESMGKELLAVSISYLMSGQFSLSVFTVLQLKLLCYSAGDQHYRPHKQSPG